LIGKEYKISARTPIFDMNGDLFFTAKEIRSWIYGRDNIL